MEQIKELDEVVKFKSAELRIVGFVGMSGIGKTTLADAYFKKWTDNFVFNKYIFGIREKSKEHGSDWLKGILMNGEDNDNAEMFTKKILVVLDDVSHKDQSSIEELVDDTYVVSGLNDKEALQLFNHHAEGSFPELSKKCVEYAGGNPRALEELGKELCGKDEDQWEARLVTLPHCCNPKILTELRFSYDKLSDQQKDPYVPESGEAVRDLVEMLLICISAGRIEMHNLLCTLGKQLGSSNENKSGERMWNDDESIVTLWSEHGKKEKHKVRGIFLDTSKFEENKGKALDKKDFIRRFNPQTLRYLKIYDSLCPQQCEVDCKVNLPERLNFPFPEIRYFHWLKFPLDDLPSDFNPKNLIDLRLPYSKIKHVWKEAKHLTFASK
ncbi:PREDICTED: disease resistance protein LAZ5-like [Camelina sativa]|uniref:Disease resistance protein LAZ5-like n=1 Tax=Camelina sativa TaxID=90675 RepID=A0ABM1QLB7_CAMSA|nr:PREDICTED: disease resistance protein LAZ5-like [Camelina sativa]